MKHKTLTPFTLLLYWLSGTLMVGGVHGLVVKMPAFGWRTYFDLLVICG